LFWVSVVDRVQIVQIGEECDGWSFIFDLFAYIHGNIGAIHALSDDFAIVNKDRSLIRGKCQLSLMEKI
jgi:hypothetical protein